MTTKLCVSSARLLPAIRVERAADQITRRAALKVGTRACSTDSGAETKSTSSHDATTDKNNPVHRYLPLSLPVASCGRNHGQERRFPTTSSRKSRTAKKKAKEPYKLPSTMPMDLKIRYVKSVVPVGSMTMDMVDFCLNACRTLGQQRNISAMEQAGSLLKRLEAEGALNRPSRDFPPLSTTPYNRLLRGWARCSDAPAHQKLAQAQSILRHMKEQNVQNPRSYPSPDDYTYLAALFVYMSAAKEATTLELQHDITHAARSLIESLERQRQADQRSGGPPLPKAFYEALLQVHAHQASLVYGAAAAAEDVLLKLSGWGAEYPEWQPDAATFNRVLQAWCACREEKGADRAYEILKLQVHLGPPAEPDAITFGTVISAYARRRLPEQAEEVWRSCLHYFQGTTDPAVDLTGCFNAVVAAWSNSGREDAVKKVQDLMRSVHDNPLVHDEGVAHACLIQAFLCRGDVQQAHDYLMYMLHQNEHGLGPFPPSGTIRDVIFAWSRCERQDRAERASQLLDYALTLNESHSTLDSTTFHVALELWCDTCASSRKTTFIVPRIRHVLEQAEQRQQASSFIYQRIIHTLCRVGSEDAVHHACDVLQRFQRHLDDPRNSHLEWTPVRYIGSYTVVIAALSRLRNPDSAERALAVFSNIPRTGPRSLEPNIRTYTSVLQAAAYLRTERSAQVAAELFRELKELDKDPKRKFRFDPLVFSVLMEASMRDADLCLDVFKHMLELHLQGRHELKPDSRCQGVVIRTLVQNGQRERAKSLSIALTKLNGGLDDNAGTSLRGLV